MPTPPTCPSGRRPVVFWLLIFVFVDVKTTKEKKCAFVKKFKNDVDWIPTFMAGFTGFKIQNFSPRMINQDPLENFLG